MASLSFDWVVIAVNHRTGRDPSPSVGSRHNNKKQNSYKLLYIWAISVYTNEDWLFMSGRLLSNVVIFISGEHGPSQCKSISQNGLQITPKG